jgi:hypothetical protein
LKVRASCARLKMLVVSQFRMLSCVTGAPKKGALKTVSNAPIRDETLNGALKIAIFRVRAEAPGPLQMCRARSAINFGGVHAF